MMIKEIATWAGELNDGLKSILICVNELMGVMNFTMNEEVWN